MDTTAFLQAVERAITVPQYQARFSQADLLALGDEEQRKTIAPMLISLNEEYLDFVEDIETEVDVRGYRVPPRAVGRTLREVKYAILNSDGSTDAFYNLARIPLEDSDRWTNAASGDPQCFWMEGDKVMLAPRPVSTGILRLWYPIKFSSLVLPSRTATISAVPSAPSVTVTSVPANIVVGSQCDITLGVPGNTILYKDLEVLDITGNTITFDEDLEDISVGDVVSLALETSLLQMPEEASDVLIQATCVRVLQALNIPEDLATAKDEMKRAIENCRLLMAPRVVGELQKIVTRNGLLNGRSVARYFPLVQVV